MEYITEKRTESTEFITFKELNWLGELIQIEITKCTPDIKSKNSLPRLWKKHGFIDRVLESYWSVTVYVTDRQGNCWGRYNPQTKLFTRYEKDKCVECRPVINFDWMFEATEENKQKIINEVIRRAYTIKR